MIDFWISAAACLGFGVLATLHPCPFAVTTVSISLLSGSTVSAARRFLYLTLFSLSYLIAVSGIGILIGLGLISVSKLSLSLQIIMPGFIGPIFIITGMILTGMIDFGRYRQGLLHKISPTSHGVSGFSFFYIGGAVALSFCPATAALFFGAMIPLAVQQDQMILFPTLYGLGAILPILILSLSLHYFHYKLKNRRWQKEIPPITGWILIIVGIYITLENTFAVAIF